MQRNKRQEGEGDVSRKAKLQAIRGGGETVAQTFETSHGTRQVRALVVNGAAWGI